MARGAPRPGRWWRDLALSVLAALGLAVLLRATVVQPFAVPGGSMAPTLLDGDVVLVSRLAYGLKLPFVGRTLLPLGTPRRGDVVILRHPRQPTRLLARRVIGLAGEVVELREQQLFVGGVAQPRLPMGELAYGERDEATGAIRVDACRRYREMLALGPLEGPVEDGPEGQARAWARATASAEGAGGLAMGHDLLQCRRVRAGRIEGPFGPIREGHVFVLGDNRDRSSDGRDGGWEVPLEDLVGRVSLVGWGWGPGGWWFGARSGPGVRTDRLLKPVE